jgi:hypothetical protein
MELEIAFSTRSLRIAFITAVSISFMGTGCIMKNDLTSVRSSDSQSLLEAKGRIQSVFLQFFETMERKERLILPKTTELQSLGWDFADLAVDDLIDETQEDQAKHILNLTDVELEQFVERRIAVFTNLKVALSPESSEEKVVLRVLTKSEIENPHPAARMTRKAQ